ncbi:hypothetical protein M8C21_032813 [Ambrosia artemisiifolia]|uniref:Germin-like protein n=1 Tax=Ambrosia artemisiifolia TaxID=4212 RepID=A0AAD5CVP9_AMBAR|nr:hypothetical protein M8C21_032813 [Ambrosia artemisiifolia]
MADHRLATFAVLVLVFTAVWATDHSPLQDFCVADMSGQDFAPWGVIPPHTHPRATEILTVLEGQIEVGFVTSNPENRHISKVLNKGDVFVFPVNLVHYQRNTGNTYAVAIVALSSQNPGVNLIGSAVFGSNPDISTDILAKAFQVSADVISDIQLKF